MPIVYKPHPKQEDFHRSRARVRGAFAGKRGGKTEAGAVETIIHAEQKIGYTPSAIDPCLGVVIAPTNDMLTRLSLQKLMAYGGGFIKDFHETRKQITWHNGTVIYAISADKPERLEGVKANFIWIDEAFQVSEQLFLEALARVSDTQGRVWCTGSLGTQYTNPKAHWCYKYFKEKPLVDSEVFEWATVENPYFPADELVRLKDTLDPRTYRQMFEIDWAVPGTALVYDEFSDANLIQGYTYRKDLPTYVSIDWGWTHDLACLFFQYDAATDTVYLFDEIIKSKLKISQLYEQIWSRPYHINEYICDIAGNQEREQTGISNVQWFKEKGIHFKFRSSAITHGVSIVRSYIKNSKGKIRFYLDEKKCPKALDGILNYSYQEKNGQIVSENPLKQNDDAVDALRYYFVNKHDSMLRENEVRLISR